MDILTVKLLVLNKEEAKVIWDAHIKNAVLNGCAIQGLSWGDMFEERNKLQEIVHKALEGTTELDPDLPEEFIVGDKRFYQWPFGLYSDNDKTPFGEEWYSNMEELVKKYPQAVSVIGGKHE